MEKLRTKSETELRHNAIICDPSWTEKQKSNPRDNNYDTKKPLREKYHEEQTKLEASKVFFYCEKKLGLVNFCLLLTTKYKKGVDGSGVVLNGVFLRKEMMTWRLLTNRNEESDVARDHKMCDVVE